MSRFLSGLCMSFMYTPEGMPLSNREGRQLYQLDKDLIYQSDVAGATFTVPVGFVTDFASIPRLPFVYFLLNGIADEPGVVHDFLYSTATIDRAMADQVLKEACLLFGVSRWKAEAIYLGVRVGGASHYGASSGSLKGLS